MIISEPQNGSYLHETTRPQVKTKDLLLTGLVTSNEICEVLKRCQGQDLSSLQHHQVPTIMVHIIRRDGWYIKFYFFDPDTVFISVHR